MVSKLFKMLQSNLLKRMSFISHIQIIRYLNQSLHSIEKAYTKKQVKTNHQLAELNFLKDALSIGYWTMEIKEDDLYNQANEMGNGYFV